MGALTLGDFWRPGILWSSLIFCNLTGISHRDSQTKSIESQRTLSDNANRVHPNGHKHLVDDLYFWSWVRSDYLSYYHGEVNAQSWLVISYHITTHKHDAYLLTLARNFKTCLKYWYRCNHCKRLGFTLIRIPTIRVYFVVCLFWGRNTFVILFT